MSIIPRALSFCSGNNEVGRVSQSLGERRQVGVGAADLTPGTVRCQIAQKKSPEKPLKPFSGLRWTECTRQLAPIQQADRAPPLGGDGAFSALRAGLPVGLVIIAPLRPLPCPAADSLLPSSDFWGLWGVSAARHAVHWRRLARASPVRPHGQSAQAAPCFGEGDDRRTESWNGPAASCGRFVRHGQK